MSYVFGPVPSRRLGRSLGVDVVPFKTCTYDCIYCQLGRTTCKTLERKEWVPLEDVVEEVKANLSSRPDFVTLSGSGEPTLFSHIGELIDRLKTVIDVPLAVLTNGSLLWQAETRRALRSADVLIPSLDAADEHRFQQINRPHETIAFDLMLEGLIAARQELRGQYWLEVFLLAGYTSSEHEVNRLAKCVELIAPDRVQLNTVARPPADLLAAGVSWARLAKAAAVFPSPTDVIADFDKVPGDAGFHASREAVLDLLRRRPCSLDDIASGLAMHRNEVVNYVEELLAQNALEATTVSGKRYYRAMH